MDPGADAIFITSNYSRIVARELQLQERDLPRLLQGTGLAVDVLLPGDETRLTVSQQLRIIQNARQIDTRPELGLRIGRQLYPSAHGPIGYLALSSPDLLTALQALRDFLPLRIAFAKLGLELDGRWLRCTLQLKMATPAAEKRLLLECFALVLQALVESILGKTAAGARLEFEFDPPEYRGLYRDYFHAPARFCREQSQLLLPADLAHTPNTIGDPGSYALARDLCQKLLAQVPAASLSMTDQVKRLLLSMPAGTASEEMIAGALFVSKRTLARRLKQEGSGYRGIRDQLFAELAARHLRETGLSVEAVAALLGYHDSANFRRAFRRWHQLSPNDFRRREAAVTATA